MTWPRPVLWTVFLPQDVVCCQALPSGERVATTLQKISPKCRKIFNTIYFHIWPEYKAIIAGIGTYRNILIKNIINLREAVNQRAASNHVTPMWQSNVSDFPQRVFKASSHRNLLKFLIKGSFINWQMYMRSIYWQTLPKVKKKVTSSDRDLIKFVKEIRGRQMRKRYNYKQNMHRKIEHTECRLTCIE